MLVVAGGGGGATPDPACECGASVQTIEHMSNQTPHAKYTGNERGVVGWSPQC